MNRFFLLSLLLVLFLRCSDQNNDTTGSPENLHPKAPRILAQLNPSYENLNLRLDDFFTHLYSRGAFNGSVLVAKGGRIIYRKSLGLLDKRKNIQLTDTSMFQLASVSKVLTATAVLLLHERGLVDINKSFSFYFPDFPYPDVTIKDLLNHRSGLPNYIYCLNDEICRPDYHMSNAEMYTSFVLRNPPPYLSPGRRFNYCNTNYALLPLLIEKISGKAYNVFLKDEIFVPLGMNNTATIYDINLDGNNITKPYDNRWRPVAFDASDYVLGDKSIYSTPYDLFIFSEALYQNKLINAETQALAYTAFSKERRLSNYGYGWRLKNFKDSVKKEVYHNGWWHGYRSSFHRRLKDTLTVVILSNKLNSQTYQAQKVYQIFDNSPEDSTDAADEL
jgi:CubicO group peptidase (beta-lactamase class C family)